MSTKGGDCCIVWQAWFSFVGNCLSSKTAPLFCIPSGIMSALLCYFIATLYVSVLAVNRCIVSSWLFSSATPWWHVMCIFSLAFFSEVAVKVFGQFFNQTLCFSYCCFRSSFYILELSYSSDISLQNLLTVACLQILLFLVGWFVFTAAFLCWSPACQLRVSWIIFGVSSEKASP